MNILPPAKNTDIIEQQFDNELLLYCLTNHQAFCLNETSAVIWRHCDGKTSFVTLKSIVKGLTDDIILLALQDFQEKNLLLDNFQTGFLDKKINRREALQKYGSAAIALPIILSIVAPTTAQAQSNCIIAGVSFTLNSTDRNDCFTESSVSRCCDRSIRATQFDGLNTVICTCGFVVVPPA